MAEPRALRRVASRRADHVCMYPFLNHPSFQLSTPQFDCNTMTRASRVAAGSAFFTALYLLAFFAYIPVPLVEEKTAGEILPVVCMVGLSIQQ